MKYHIFNNSFDKKHFDNNTFDIRELTYFITTVHSSIIDLWEKTKLNFSGPF